jgi:hypothetical protein
MNHLRELLSEPVKSINFRPDETSAEFAGRIHTSMQHYGEKAMCFWCGEVAQLEALSWEKSLARLPYEVCWFEFQVGICIAGVLAHETADGISLTRYSRLGGAWIFEWAASCDSIGDPLTVAPQSDSTTSDASNTAAGIATFLTAMNCCNVQREEHVPEQKLQKARVKRGKAPLFSYWTLQLNGKSERGEDQGGTHASPRVHLRRGHPRQYTPGKWTWVQAHAVGNKSLGVVHKDYSAGPALLVPAR